MDFRVGFGWDFHLLEEGRKLVLGTIDIPSNKGLVAHSDGDVLLHALGDALLGAIGERDIGYHFPDTDPVYLGIASSRLIEEIKEMVTKKGYRIVNIDSTIIAQSPRLSDYIPRMQEEIAILLGISPDAVGIKAKTNEGVGRIGKGKGISAYAVVLLTRDELRAVS